MKPINYTTYHRVKTNGLTGQQVRVEFDKETKLYIVEVLDKQGRAVFPAIKTPDHGTMIKYRKYLCGDYL